jgi:hypothetical protein
MLHGSGGFFPAALWCRDKGVDSWNKGISRKIRLGREADTVSRFRVTACVGNRTGCQGWLCRTLDGMSPSGWTERRSFDRSWGRTRSIARSLRWPCGTLSAEILAP